MMNIIKPTIESSSNPAIIQLINQLIVGYGPHPALATGFGFVQRGVPPSRWYHSGELDKPATVGPSTHWARPTLQQVLHSLGGRMTTSARILGHAPNGARSPQQKVVPIETITNNWAMKVNNGSING